MTRVRTAPLLVGLGILLLLAWIASRTYWADVKVPLPPKGEARTNPFYAAQRFVEALGARGSRYDVPTWHRIVTQTPTSSVIVLADWHWTLSDYRRVALESWVESGGRLVVDATMIGGHEFERWSGISRFHRARQQSDEDNETGRRERCRTLRDEHGGTSSSGPVYSVCSVFEYYSLKTEKPIVWALRDESGIHAMRVNVGRGSVTYINGNPFTERRLFDGDHGRLFVAATELRRGDDVHFLSEADHPSLLALVWQYGAGVVILTLALIGAALWRAGIRFGPPAAAPSAARRSLAEQIRGTGQFALRFGGSVSLHAACVRALGDAAQQRTRSYISLSAAQQPAVLARLTGFDADVLASAMHTGPRSAHELRRTVTLLEAARRQLLIEPTRSPHGTS